MLSPSEAPVGSIFLVTSTGFNGRWIAAAQAFLRGEGSKYTHGGIVLSEGWIVEAEPGGAQLRPVGTLEGRRNLLISDAPVQWWLRTSTFPELYLAREQAEEKMRNRIDAAGRTLVGTPYSLRDFYALAAWEVDWPFKAWARKRVEDSGHLICSALIDKGLDRAGLHLYDDDRLPGDVTPGDLYEWIEEHG